MTLYQGAASFVSPHEILCANGEEKIIVQAEKVVIATGSKPTPLRTAPFDGEAIVSSTEALCFHRVPEHLVIIGGGVIGVELGSVWQRFGSKVTILEAQPEILAQMDQDISRTMTTLLKRQGMVIQTGACFQTVEKRGEILHIVYEQSGENKSIVADKLMIAIGRRPNTEGLNLEGVGVKLDQGGRIVTDANFQTNINHIYAIGDVKSGMMLAHKASEEAMACAEIISGCSSVVNYEAIPSIIYTNPEVASVGLSQQDCDARGLSYNIGKFPFSANGRAKCAGETDGFVKIIADKMTDRILGAHIVGAYASELISELVIAMEYQASAEDIARSIHGHPCLSEAIKEAALAVSGHGLHL